MARATLIGMIKNNDPSSRDESGLKAGAQALFLLKSRKEIRRITTSAITSIIHERASPSVDEKARSS
jgi:hypothetical protein